MERIADHPDIAAARRTGYPSWMDADWDDEDAEGEDYFGDEEEIDDDN